MRKELDFNAIDSFNKSVIDAINFTARSEDAFYDEVDLAAFKDNDAETIFNYLKPKFPSKISVDAVKSDFADTNRNKWLKINA